MESAVVVAAAAPAAGKWNYVKRGRTTADPETGGSPAIHSYGRNIVFVLSRWLALCPTKQTRVNCGTDLPFCSRLMLRFTRKQEEEKKKEITLDMLQPSRYKPNDLEQMAEDTKFSKREQKIHIRLANSCLLYTSPSPRDRQKSRMPSSA